LVFLLLETIIFATQFQTMRKVSIGVVQMSCVADKETNLQKAIAGIEKAAAQGAQIVSPMIIFY
jgi:N-carbamoylputrescine amidase